MAKFLVYGSIVASKYLGEYEAETEEEAEEMALKDAYVSICHQCSRDVEDPEIVELFFEKIED